MLIDFGDARFAVVTTASPCSGTARRASSCTAPTACCRCWATTGRPRATSCGATTRGAGSSTRRPTRPGRGPTGCAIWSSASRRRGARTRPEHAYHALEIMLAAQAAGADGRAREIASTFPAPELERLGPGATPTASTIRGARHEPGRAAGAAGSSPRPTFAGPALIRRADVRGTCGATPPRARCSTGSTPRPSRCTCSSSGCRRAAGSGTPRTSAPSSRPTRSCTCSQGVLVIADPETGEVQRAEAGESVFFRRDTWHHAFALGPEPLRVLELFAPPPAAGASSAYARGAAVPRGVALRRRRRCSATGRPPQPPGRGCGCCARPTSLWRRDLGVLCGVLVEHRAPHGGDARDRARARPPRRTSTAATRC